VGDLLKGVKK